MIKIPKLFKKKKNSNSSNSLFSRIMRIVWLVFRIALVAFFALFAIAGGIFAGYFFGFIESTDLSVIQEIQQSVSLNLTSFVYTVDEYGNEQQVEVLYDEENRVWAELDEIPDHLKEAFIAIEDERFYSHQGFDIKRTVGAAIGYVQKKITGSGDSTYGGSTITQQLIKNVTGDDDYSIERKIEEIYRAYKLEEVMDKDEILELYLNTIYLSQQCNGVKSAAKVYFNKDLGELSLHECATIAAITQFPTKYDPKRNPENNKQRRDVILNKMYELGYISLVERDSAKIQPVTTVSSDQTDAYISTTSYYSDALINQVLNDLIEQKGYSADIAEKMLYCGGLKIYTAMDPKVQSIMDAYYADSSHFPTTSGSTIVQSAMVVIDPSTGYVAGVMGGRGEKTASRTLNRATQTLRQPGSSIKPLAIYAPAVEYGIVTPSSTVSDVAITINGWTPRNDDRGFRGNIPVSSALAGSRNVPAVRILQAVGLERSYSFLTKNFRISSLVDGEERNGKVFSDKGYASIGLGGLTDGVSVLEMAAAYVPFVAEGYYYEPAFYTKVLDSKNNVVLERNPSPQPAISESTAVTMTQMLRGVVTSGTGTSARLNNMPAAGKTGTTSNNHDRWFVGYTPYYVGAVWYGYDSPSSLRGISGNPSARVWKGVMDQIHADLPYTDFNTLGSTSHCLVCADSGLLPNSTCDNLTFGDYSRNLAPKEHCDEHPEIDFGKDELVVQIEEPSEVSSDVPVEGGVVPNPDPNAGVEPPIAGEVVPEIPVEVEVVDPYQLPPGL